MGRLLALSNQELLPSLLFFYFLAVSLFGHGAGGYLVFSGLDVFILGARHMMDYFLLSGWGMMRSAKISVHRCLIQKSAGCWTTLGLWVLCFFPPMVPCFVLGLKEALN
ncbi:hypothetical protein BO78DRAFT_159350 [Aspergillus sclerotiicarbonarius CBS 121057]|uniref:Uncharacterized protein n=1 Tax=Aspergillus sclerotiicarbonarius (strain CBS 121057 / IBT 28362) TaxID=1448318 RepID=A0A319E6E8_ASPSB|nr:hypothetical protein BO78DRAFT_159350 [Aspergillus sclerotiicarbonarius CBS 121057]